MYDILGYKNLTYLYRLFNRYSTYQNFAHVKGIVKFKIGIMKNKTQKTNTLTEERDLKYQLHKSLNMQS